MAVAVALAIVNIGNMLEKSYEVEFRLQISNHWEETSYVSRLIEANDNNIGIEENDNPWMEKVVAAIELEILFRREQSQM